MLLAALERPILYSRPDGNGRTIVYHYYYEVTWVVLALALAWVVWLLLRRHMRARRARRPPRRNDYSLLRRVVKIKHELSQTFLRPGFSANIHAVGVGLLGGHFGEYCIQVFVLDANAEMWDGAGAEPLPDLYRGVPVVLIEMDAAGFLSSDAGLDECAPCESAPWESYPGGIREAREIIVGGLSGANTNLTGESGTIGYFCTRKSLLPRRKEVCLLSNSHVFADLRKSSVDESDLIMQPSPGEAATGRPVGALLNFSALKFDGGVSEPNHVDAALAKLWEPQHHRPLIPFVGSVKGYVPKGEVEVGEPARKFGRTTGYTEGRVFSIYLDIWIRYDRTGQSAFFDNQILIEPAAPRFPKFVSKGDSGSLLVDERQHALGLIFAGATDSALRRANSSNTRPPNAQADPSKNNVKRVEGYGVANPISEVLDRLKIDLLV
jgi:hypothetical protein